MSDRDPSKITRSVRGILDADYDAARKVYAIVASVLDNAAFAACLSARAQHPEDRTAAQFTDAVDRVAEVIKGGFATPDAIARIVLRPCEAEAIRANRKGRS